MKNVFETYMYLINKQLVFQNNIIEKYYKIGRSELHLDISGLYKDGSYITHYYILLPK